jgi:hypothetical protein
LDVSSLWSWDMLLTFRRKILPPYSGRKCLIWRCSRSAIDQHHVLGTLPLPWVYTQTVFSHINFDHKNGDIIALLQNCNTFIRSRNIETESATKWSMYTTCCAWFICSTVHINFTVLTLLTE